MNVSNLMTHDVRCCQSHDTLQTAARIMWQNDCGCVPVVDGERRVIGMITDRDICMAALHQGRPLEDMNVDSASSKTVACASTDDSIEEVATLMRLEHVRRIPIIDAEGRLVGIVSMADLARSLELSPGDSLGDDMIAETLAAITQPRPTEEGDKKWQPKETSSLS